MADGNNAAAEAAGEAAAAVVEHTEQVEAGAQNAIETARAEADAAREESARIAAAALSTSLGQEIQRDRESFSTWRTEHETRVNTELARVPALEAQVTELKMGLAALLGAVTLAAPSASIPPTSETPAPPAHQANPENVNGDAPPPPAPPPHSQRPGKRLL